MSLPVKALGCRAEQLSRTAAFCGRRRLVLDSCEHGGKLGAARAVALSQQSGFDELAHARASLCLVIKVIDQVLARVFLVAS
jgi:hypothetical protein